MKEMDPIEKLMDCRVADMTGSELATYIKTYLSARWDIEMPMDGLVERKTMEAFKRRYPGDRAGRIVQWVMLHHHGRKDGRYITTSVFSQKMKWWCDMMYLELQAHEQREAATQVGTEKLTEKFFDMSDL